MVLLALYLASTASLITISVVEPSQLQKKLQEQAELKYVSECMKFFYCYGLCFLDTWATVYNT